MTLPPTLSGRGRAHVESELAAFLALLVRLDCRAYLEVGARDGDTFAEVARILRPGATLVAIDLPDGKWGRRGSVENLARAMAFARGRGHHVAAILGDSRDPAPLALLRSHRFDVVFIDGDHTYEGARSDWEHYGPLASRAVAFHDIVGEGQQRGGNVVEVPRLWREIVTARPRHAEAFVGQDSQMGIGIVHVGGADVS